MSEWPGTSCSFRTPQDTHVYVLCYARRAERANENRRGVARLATGTKCGSMSRVVEDGGGHVIPLAAFACEFLKGGEDMAEKIERRLARVAAANFLKAFEAELLIVEIACLRQAIRAEKQGIAGLKLQGEFVVLDAGKKARRDARNLKGAALPPAEKQRTGHSGAGNDHFPGVRI